MVPWCVPDTEVLVPADEDALLRAFVEQRRMKISGEYQPCYQVLA